MDGNEKAGAARVEERKSMQSELAWIDKDLQNAQQDLEKYEIGLGRTLAASTDMEQLLFCAKGLVTVCQEKVDEIAKKRESIELDIDEREEQIRELEERREEVMRELLTVDSEVDEW